MNKQITAITNKIIERSKATRSAYLAKIDAQKEFGYTPLHLAAYNGYKATVGLLIDKGAKVNAKNNERNTPLHLAACNGHTQIVELLINSIINFCIVTGSVYVRNYLTLIRFRF